MSTYLAAITGVQGWVPKDILTNHDLEQMVDTSDEWIKSRTGIEKRHILKGKGLATSDMAAAAVKQLLEKKNIAPEEIDLIICATVTPDMFFPATANIIADKVGLKNAFGYDIGAACSGFIYALTTATKFIETGSCKKVLVVGSDKMSSIVDYTDRKTCILFGDAAGVVLLEPAEDENVITDTLLKSDGSGRELLYQRAGGSLKPASIETVTAKEHFIYQDGPPVFKAAVKNMALIVQEVMTRNHLSTDDVAWLIPHQANKRIIDAVARLARFPIEKVAVNIQKYGNTTAATIPLCLWDWETKFKKGDNIILTAFGGGFTWGAIYLKWAYDSIG